MRFFVLFAFLVSAIPALAVSASPPEMTGAGAKKERKICKQQLVATSLHGSKRVCRTAAEWKRTEREAGPAADVQSKASTRGN